MNDFKPINAFIFDLGKVIVDGTPAISCIKFQQTKAPEVLVNEVLDLDWFREVDGDLPTFESDRRAQSHLPGLRH